MEAPDEEQGAKELRDLEDLVREVKTKVHRLHNLNLTNKQCLQMDEALAELRVLAD